MHSCCGIGGGGRRRHPSWQFARKGSVKTRCKRRQKGKFELKAGATGNMGRVDGPRCTNLASICVNARMGHGACATAPEQLRHMFEQDLWKCSWGGGGISRRTLRDAAEPHLPGNLAGPQHSPPALSPTGRPAAPFFRPSTMPMIEVILNDRLGKKVRVKCNDDDTIGDLKKLVAARRAPR